MVTIDTLDDIARELASLLVLDPRLANAAEIAGPLPLRRSKPGFESLASIVVSQQVSKASADAITARLVDLGALFTPSAFQTLDDTALLNAGLSRPKLKTLRFVAEAAASGTLDLGELCTMDADMAMVSLTAISGIGPWTAEVYLLFCAGHPDIFPSGDIALQNAMQTILALSERPSAKQAAIFAKDWSPHRGTASRLLWAYYGVMRGGVLKSPV
jgi:DNA-3-methyladenine glycosylase II